MWHRIGKRGERFWGRRGAGIFFTDGKQVLLLKRSDKGDNANTWGLPGGSAKQGETESGTARREVREECGTVQGKHFDSLIEENGHHHWKTFFYKIENPFDCKLSDEHTEYRWVPFDKIEELTLHPKLQDSWDRHMSVVAKHFPREDVGFREWLILKEGLADKDFYQDIQSNPDNSDARLIYADWLEESGDPRGQIIRMVENGQMKKALRLLKMQGKDYYEIFDKANLYPNQWTMYAIDLARKGVTLNRETLESIIQGNKIVGNAEEIGNVRRLGSRYYYSTSPKAIAGEGYVLMNFAMYARNRLVSDIVPIARRLDGLLKGQEYPLKRLLEYKLFNRNHIWTTP